MLAKMTGIIRKVLGWILSIWGALFTLGGGVASLMDERHQIAIGLLATFVIGVLPLVLGILALRKRRVLTDAVASSQSAPDLAGNLTQETGPFRLRALRGQTWWDRLVSQAHKRDALVELENMLATGGAMAVQPAHIAELSERYKCDLTVHYSKQLLELWGTYLRDCASRGLPTHQERQAAAHLRSVFVIGADAARSLQSQVGSALYKDTLRTVTRKRELADPDLIQLDKIAVAFELATAITDSVYANEMSRMYHEMLNAMVEDDRLSSEDEERLLRLQADFGFTVEFDEATELELARMKLLWGIENGTELPDLEVSVNLQRGEKGRFETPCEWWEQRRVVHSYRYSGPVLRFKIIKGVYYRMGSTSVRTNASDEWQRIDHGRAVLTSKRIIFVGERGNKTIPYTKVLDLEMQEDGVHVLKDTGKSPIIVVHEKIAEVFSSMLGRLVFDSGGARDARARQPTP